MKLKENSKGIVEVEMAGVDLGFANLLAKRMLESKGVSFAAATVDHPLTGKTILQIKAKDAEKELKKAVGAVKDEVADFEAALKKAK